MASVATLELRVDASGAISSIKQVKQETDELGESGERASSKFDKASKIISAAAASAGAALVAGIVKNTIDAEFELAQLEATVRSTGGAAGFTADQLVAYADSLELVSTKSSGEIQSGLSRLLTYSGITGEKFKEAAQATLDMSVALGVDMTSAAETVGKALNYPIEGLGALSKQGFIFTEEQKEQIRVMTEAGDLAGAQAIILDELRASYEGSGAAARDTLGGALIAVKNAFGAALTANGQFSEALTDLLNSVAAIIPRVRDYFDQFVGGIQLLALDAGVLWADLGNEIERAMGRALLAVSRFLLEGVAKFVPGMAEAADALNRVGNEMIRSTLAETAALERYREETARAIVGIEEHTTAQRALGNVITESHGSIDDLVESQQQHTAELKKQTAALTEVRLELQALPVQDVRDVGMAFEHVGAEIADVKPLAEEVGETLHDKIGGFFTALHTEGNTAIDAVKGGLSSLGDKIFSVFGSASGTLKGFTGGLLAGAITGMLTELADGLLHSGRQFKRAIAEWQRAVDDINVWISDTLLDLQGQDMQLALNRWQRELTERMQEAFRTFGQGFLTELGRKGLTDDEQRLFSDVMKSLTGGFEDIDTLRQLIASGQFRGKLLEILQEYLDQLIAFEEIDERTRERIAAQHEAADATKETTEAVHDFTDSLLDLTGVIRGSLPDLPGGLTRGGKKKLRPDGTPTDDITPGGDDTILTRTDPYTVPTASVPNGIPVTAASAPVTARGTSIAQATVAQTDRILGELTTIRVRMGQAVAHLSRMVNKGFTAAGDFGADVAGAQVNSGSLIV